MKRKEERRETSKADLRCKVAQANTIHQNILEMYIHGNYESTHQWVRFKHASCLSNEIGVS